MTNILYFIENMKIVNGVKNLFLKNVSEKLSQGISIANNDRYNQLGYDITCLFKHNANSLIDKINQDAEEYYNKNLSNFLSAYQIEYYASQLSEFKSVIDNALLTIGTFSPVYFDKNTDVVYKLSDKTEYSELISDIFFKGIRSYILHNFLLLRFTKFQGKVLRSDILHTGYHKISIEYLCNTDIILCIKIQQSNSTKLSYYQGFFKGENIFVLLEGENEEMYRRAICGNDNKVIIANCINIITKATSGVSNGDFLYFGREDSQTFPQSKCKSFIRTLREMFVLKHAEEVVFHKSPIVTNIISLEPTDSSNNDQNMNMESVMNKLNGNINVDGETENTMLSAQREFSNQNYTTNPTIAISNASVKVSEIKGATKLMTDNNVWLQQCQNEISEALLNVKSTVRDSESKYSNLQIEIESNLKSYQNIANNFLKYILTPFVKFIEPDLDNFYLKVDIENNEFYVQKKNNETQLRIETLSNIYKQFEPVLKDEEARNFLTEILKISGLNPDEILTQDSIDIESELNKIKTNDR